MEGQQILDGGINELTQLKEELEGLAAVKEEIKKLTAETERFEKKLESEEKTVKDEIKTAVDKARNDIIKGFDKEINHEKVNIKEAKEKKSKEKAKGVKKRIEKETESYVAENKNIRKEIKQRFKERGIPGYCDSTWFYTLFMPKGIKDILILVLVMLGLIVGIPMLVSCLITDTIWLRVIIYILVLIFEAAIYITMFLLTRDKDKYILEEMRHNRELVKENSAKIRQIKKNIKKDRDESMYNLDEFDSKIKVHEQKITDILNQKNAAVEEFDNNTKPQMINELTAQKQERIDNATAEAANSKSAKADSEQKLKDITNDLNERYANELGSDMLNIQSVNKMIKLIEEGQVQNIREAINRLRANNA